MVISTRAFQVAFNLRLARLRTFLLLFLAFTIPYVAAVLSGEYSIDIYPSRPENFISDMRKQARTSTTRHGVSDLALRLDTPTQSYRVATVL
jgi:hypothetical protein